MKCFQVLSSVVLVASAAHAGVLQTYGGSYGGSYGFAAAPAAVSYAAPAAVSYAAPVAAQVATVHQAPSVQSHEIHTGGAGNTVRVEEYKAGGQVIRVHDAPQRPTEVVNVQAPAPAANHYRVIARSGPTQIERAVFQDPSVQVYDVVNPPKPADRVINIQRAPPTPAHVELVAEQQHGGAQVTVGGDEPNVQVVHAGTYHAAPAVATATYHAPAVATATYHAAPAVATFAAPAVATAYHAAPAVATAAYGFNYGASNGGSVVLHKA